MVTGCRFEVVGDCKVCKYNQDCDRAEGLKRKSGMASTVFEGSGAIGLIMKDICSKHFKEEVGMRNREESARLLKMAADIKSTNQDASYDEVIKEAMERGEDFSNASYVAVAYCFG